MLINPSLKLEVLNWQAVRDDVSRVNPTTAAFLDKLSLDDSFRFYKVRYPYGCQILQYGRFYLPGENSELFSLQDVPNSIVEDLGYNDHGNPMGIITKNSMEQFVSVEDRVIPFTIMGPGTLLGLSTTLDKLTMPNNYASFFLWELTAGARSVFLIPKIYDQTSFKKIKRKYNLVTPQPEHLQKQWFLFRELAKQLQSSWHTEVIFFPKKIADSLKDPAWMDLRSYFLEVNRRTFEFWRNTFSWQITFSRIEKLRNLKNSAHILDTIKHLFALSTGVFVGFKPSTDDTALPFSLLKNIYLNDYGLEDYAPTFMEPAAFTHEDPIYYSLSYPTSVEYSPKATSASSNISDLDELSMVLAKYLKEIRSREFYIEGTPLARVPDSARFEFFHSNPSHYSTVQGIEHLIEADPRFAASQTPSNPSIAKNGTFFKGCIRISSNR